MFAGGYRDLKLRKKTLIILGLTFASLIVIQNAVSQLILLNSFATLEEEDTFQNVERVISAINNNLNKFDAYVYDWAAWDDTYEFIQDINQEYIQSNLVDETFIASELNLMIFANSSGKIVYIKAFDLENEEEIAVPKSIQEHFTNNRVLLQHYDTDASVVGIIDFPDNPMIVVSRPIIKSNDEGPILGSLIMGYYLDSARLESIAKTTHLSLEMQQTNELQIPTDFQEAIQLLSEDVSTIVKPTNSNSISGYTLFDDIYGEPVLVLRIDIPRNIYTQGGTSISYFVVLLLATGITFSVVIILFLEKTVLSRLAQLNRSVNYVRSEGNPSKRVSVDGRNDELTDLADEINEMLSTLESSQNKLHMTNEKLSVVGKLTRHDVRNKLSVIANSLYLIKKKTMKDPKATNHLNTIELAIDQIAKIFDFAKTYEMLGVEKLSYIDVEKYIHEIAMFHGLSTVTLVNECSGLTVLADSLLKQLFYNLIDNSLKHGETVTSIRIYYEEEKDKLMLIYEDNGIGIPEPEKERIFMEGYGKGTGYGLYLIKKICEAYGWTIQETGDQKKGAKFVMTISKMDKNKNTNYYLK